MTILQVQLLLQYLGYNPGKADGIFGGNTRAAVREFQGNAKIGQDGIPGPNTYAALKKAVINDDFKSKYSTSVSSATNPATGSTKSFSPRLTRPEAGNPYYNTRSRGGYSDAITGSPQDVGCNVLCNCVGWACGRFNHIYNLLTGYDGIKYPKFCCNAEQFIEVAKAYGLEVGMTPRPGAIMCWQKGATLSSSDGAGHVAVVEKVISSTQIMTSESGYNYKAFWNQTRNKGNGNWGAGSTYKFRGFIYNPASSGW